MTRLEAFKLVDDEGNLYDAVKITPTKTTRTLDGVVKKMDKLPTYKLTTGEHLNPDGDGFKSLHTGLVLKRL